MESLSCEADGGHCATGEEPVVIDSARRKATKEDRGDSEWEGKLEKEGQR